MDTKEVGKKLVEYCRNGLNLEAIASLYSKDIVSVEATGTETAGKEAVINKSKKWAEGIEIHGEKVEGPFYSGKNQFAVTFRFEVTPKATGKRQSQYEVGVYTINDKDQIIREQFFYEGNW